MLHIKQTATTNNWLTFIAQLTQTHDTSRPANILKLLKAAGLNKENNNNNNKKTKQNKNKLKLLAENFLTQSTVVSFALSIKNYRRYLIIRRESGDKTFSIPAVNTDFLSGKDARWYAKGIIY